MISLRPGAAGKWGETAVPDSTNFYVTVGAGGSVLGRVNWEEEADASRFGDTLGM